MGYNDQESRVVPNGLRTSEPFRLGDGIGRRTGLKTRGTSLKSQQNQGSSEENVLKRSTRSPGLLQWGRGFSTAEMAAILTFLFSRT